MKNSAFRPRSVFFVYDSGSEQRINLNSK